MDLTRDTRNTPVMRFRALWWGIFLVTLIALAGCGPLPGGVHKLKVGLLPIIDSVPFYVAEQEGFYKQQNLQVELVNFASALERDAAIQAGEIDGQLADLIASGLLNRGKERIKIVKETYRALPEKAMISLLAGPKGRVKSVADLKGAKIAISHNTIIDYMTDQLLEGTGVTPADVNKVEVSKIPVRMEMLAKGQVDAATLPEPLATLAVMQGAQVLRDDSKSQIGLSVLMFRSDFIQKQPDVVRRMVLAHDQAVKAVNATPEKYRGVLAEKAKLPDILKDTFAIPKFPETKVPTAQDVQRAVNWMVQVGLLSEPLPYEGLVDASFLPR